MKTAVYTLALLFALSCRSDKEIDPTEPNLANPLAEFSVDGLGRIALNPYSTTIHIVLPSGFQRDSLRINYQLGEPLADGTGSPASGSVIYFRERYPIELCLRKPGSSTGQCDAPYRIIVRYADPLTVESVPSSFERTIDAASVPFSVQFRLTNQGTNNPDERRFKLRFTNQQTGFVYTAESWQFGNGNKRINQPDNPGKTVLNMQGVFPLQMPAGRYNMVLIVTDQSSRSPGVTELPIAEPFILKTGKPLLTGRPSMVVVDNALSLQGRNLTPTTTATIRLANDFSPSRSLIGQVEDDTQFRFPVSPEVEPGVYLAETSFENGQPVRSLVTVPQATPSHFFSYVGAFGNYRQTVSEYTDLRPFQPGDSLEVRYEFVYLATGQLLDNRNQQRYPEKVMLVSLRDPSLTYNLGMGNLFVPYYNVPYFNARKLTLPKTVPKGEYQLVFEDILGNRSLPHYRKIVIQ